MKPHLESSYDLDLGRVRSLLDEMGALTSEMLAGALRAIEHGGGVEARQIPAQDRGVDALEIEIDERCLKLLARWQPVGADLRFVAATLKVVTDLERVGDHCVNVCDRLAELGAYAATPPTDFEGLSSVIAALWQDALAAFRTEDVGAAIAVIERRPLVDVLVRQIARGCFERAWRHPELVAAVIRWHEIAGYLERIAAHATNVAEMVVFLVRGEDIRHAPVIERRLS